MEFELCLACCGSLPTSSREQAQVFRTRCCQRPICPNCLKTNPRLSRYHPCLSCLAGVHAVSSSSRGRDDEVLSKGSSKTAKETPHVGESFNLDGSIKDQDLFTLGDDEDDDDVNDVKEKEGSQKLGGGNDDGRGDGSGSSSPPPAYREQPTSPPQGVPLQVSSEVIFDASSPDEEADEAISEAPKRHYIKKSETLLGIALKYRVDGRTLCRLNNLPISTLSTTPHLLHTRTFLVLPYDTKVSVSSSVPSVPDKEDSTATRDDDRDRTRRRTLERAAKRFQIVTKEEDWRIANAYVAIADSEASSSSSSSSGTRAAASMDKEEKEWRLGQRRENAHASDSLSRHAEFREKLQSEFAPASKLERGSIMSNSKGKGGLGDEEGGGGANAALRAEATTALALDAYLDDDEWEAQERARGRGPSSLLGKRDSKAVGSRRSGVRGFSSWFGSRTSEKAL